MQYGLKREVGYTSDRPRLGQRRHRDPMRPDTNEVGARREGNVIAALRSVETSLPGELRVAVAPFPTDISAEMSPSTLADSLAALVRGVASHGLSDRNIRITVTPCELLDGQASAAGVLPGAYVAFQIEHDRDGSRATAAGSIPVDTSGGLAAARDALERAGGSVGLSRAPTGGTRFTAYVPSPIDGRWT